jgi:hypothetical protein
LSTEYGSEVPSIPALVSGFPGIAISTSVASLVPNTTYHFRSKGVNSDSVYYGNDISYTTLAVLPIPVTGNASAISSISAQLNGTVTANNSATTVMFEYGTTEAYGSTAIGTPDLVNGMAATPISSTVTGLLANTLYHYRVVATNQSGTAYGADQSFLTSQEIPATISLTGIITGDTCFNAIDTILIAGTPNTFIVSPAGNVTLIAGASIRLLPGAKVDLGGYLYAYITTTETYCFNPRKSIAAAMTGNVGTQVSNPVSGTDRTLKIWPNPASDYFFINLTSGQAPIPSTIEIFTATGTCVAQTRTFDAVTSVSVNFLKSGIYFVKVTSGYGTATARLVKM